MKSINDIRRENLRDIINRDFDGRQVRPAERLEINANVISRWLKPATDKTTRRSATQWRASLRLQRISLSFGLTAIT